MKLRQIWAAHKESLEKYLTAMENVVTEDIEAANLKFSSDQRVEEILTVQKEEAVIEINGVLTQNGPSAIARFLGFGGTGYNQILEAVEMLLSNDEVKHVRLVMDTPGGEASGVDEVYQAIKLMSDSKEVVAENRGMIASAGYWLALAADKIVATSPINETGSIGVIIAGYDWESYLAKFGLRVVRIISKHAPNKAATISNEKGRKLLQLRINSLERVFISRVAESRGVSYKTVAEKFGKGGVLIAQDPGQGQDDALSVGMIDEVVGMIGKIKKQTNDKKTIKSSQKKEVLMTLQEFLEENPSAKAEIDSISSKAYEKGKEEANSAIKALREKASPILNSESYPEPIRALAAKVVSGEEDMSALTACVTMHDVSVQKDASDAAADTTDGLGDTQPDAGNLSDDDGVLTSEAELEKEADAQNPKAGK